MPKLYIRKQHSTRWALWTIALGAVLACIMPWVLTHLVLVEEPRVNGKGLIPVE